MEETYLLKKESEHYKLLAKMIEKIDKSSISSILDCGSGRTSLAILLHQFKNAKIDAVVYYGDTRKIDSIKESVVSSRFKLVEKDICKEDMDMEYDLVLAHLLLGESITWGNTFQDVCNHLLDMKAKYFIIMDIKEDPNVDYVYLETLCTEKGYQILAKEEIEKAQVQVYDGFEAKNYIGYVIKP